MRVDSLWVAALLCLTILLVHVNIELGSVRTGLAARSPAVTTSTKDLDEQQDVCFLARFSGDSTLIGRDSSSFQWALESSGTMRLLPPESYTSARAHGKLYRTLAGYQKTLANKHIVLIGDSRVRYQYMSLVHFLISDRWLRCRDYEDIATHPSHNSSLTTIHNHHQADSDCFLIARGTNQSWNEWYEQWKRFS